MASSDEHETESLVEVAVLKCARHVVTRIKVTDGQARFTITENIAATPIPDVVEGLYATPVRYLVNPWDFNRAIRAISQDMHIALDAARGGPRSNDDERAEDQHQGSKATGA